MFGCRVTNTLGSPALRVLAFPHLFRLAGALNILRGKSVRRARNLYLGRAIV